MWGSMIIKEKHYGTNSKGWGQIQSGGTWGSDAGWGITNNNTGGWGYGISNNNSGGWGHPANNGGWGQPTNNTGGWGQPTNNNTGGWGQPTNNNTGGWGQPTNNNTGGWGQPTNNTGGWGQPTNNNTGGWGQPTNNTGGWGQPTNNNTGGWEQPTNNIGGWGQPTDNIGGWGTVNAGFTSDGIGKIFGNNLGGLDWIKHQQNHQHFNIVDQDQFDMLKYIQKQVIQVQQSPCKKKLQQLKQKGLKFTDDRFPPNNNSLSGEWGPIASWKQIKWFKISDKMKNAKIFVDKPQPQHIKQGYLGDCYFLAGLAALAERPDRIFNLFLQTQRNNQCSYKVKMLYKGKWMTIDMDQYVPFHADSPAFTKAVNNQLWVVLLQKAWAKMYTSYKRIQSGFPEEPLHDLTGAPIKQIFLKKDQYNKQQQWKYLLKATQLQYSMVCSSNPGSDTNKSQSGVVLGHAYTLLSAIQLNFQGQIVRLVRLRNPWRKGQFKGKWSDDDPNWNIWNYIDQNTKQKIGFSKGDDGIFFIPFDIFWAQYRSITIAEINDNASYLYKSHKDKHKEGCYFKLDIKKEGAYSLQIDKLPERSFQNSRQSNYNYPMATVELGLMTGGSIKKIQGFGNNARTTLQKFIMKPGVYIVKVLINFDPKWEKDYDVNFAVYAEYPCIINFANNQEATMFAGKQVNWKPQEQQSGSDGWNQLAGFGWNQGNNKSQQNQGWGNNQPNYTIGGWGQTANNKQGGWNQPNNNQGGWGQQPSNNQGGWGQQPSNNQGGWGNSNSNSYNNNNGWGQPSNKSNSNNGWSNNNNGW